MTVAIGAHVDQSDPIAQAQARRAPHVQIFLGDPQSYKGPQVAYPGGAAALRSAAQEAGIGLYVHAPYVINVASTNNRIRIPSRKLLQQHHDAAAEVGAVGLIVHGGHVTAKDDPAKGYDNWRKAIEALDIQIPVLVENTAGGDHAMARRLDRIAGTWEAIQQADGHELVGFCLDTCHAWAGGIALTEAVERIHAITGRIDLVHANDSRDDFDSGADRHTNFGSGHIAANELAAVVRDAAAPVVCETPGEAAEHLADFAWLEQRL
ncbi:deoxyribonuclease IV [Dermacoccaceae bacterium W4C1]